MEYCTAAEYVYTAAACIYTSDKTKNRTFFFFVFCHSSSSALPMKIEIKEIGKRSARMRVSRTLESSYFVRFVLVP